MRTLPAVMAALHRQRAPFGFETIVVDSGSTDGTIEFLANRVDRLLRIPPETFDHGATRNLAVAEARGAFVVLLVQDAEPVSDDWLVTLVEPLVGDPRVAGAFARQRPRPDARPLTRHYMARWLGASDRSRVVDLDAATYEALTPLERLDRCTFDNVCSCIRRSVWTSYPFASTPIGEDVAWAKAVLLAGYTLVFNATAQVIHSHDRSARYELARTYVLHRRLFVLFGVRTIPSFAALARAIVSSLVIHARHEKSVRSLLLAFAWPIGQYAGGLAAARGWPFERIGGV